MVVMRVGTRLVTRAAVTEIVPLDDAGIFEEAHGPIHGRNRDAIVNLGAAAIKLFDVWMVAGFCQYSGDHPTLLGHSHPFGSTECLDILLFGDVFSRLGHVASLPSVSAGVRWPSYHMDGVCHVSIGHHYRSRRSTSAATLPSGTG